MTLLPARAEMIWKATGVIAVAMVGLGLYQAFQMPDNMLQPTYGTAWAPYSDALSPWLEGALAFLFGYTPPPYLYRPTIGLFWASIIAMTGRVEMIPIVFSAWLLALGLVVVLGRDSDLRRAMAVALLVCALHFDTTLRYLFPATTNLDLAAFAITTTGLVLLVSGRGRSALPALLVGCLCLGLVAAIRGPMMLAAVPILAIRLFVVERVSWRVVAAALCVFALPSALDIGMQRTLGSVNNGLAALYCTYSDPSHSWNSTCHYEYLAKKPPGAEVVGNVARNLVSAEGLTRFTNTMGYRITRDLSTLTTVWSLVLLLAAGVLAWAAGGGRGVYSPLWRAAAAVTALAAVRLGIGGHWGAIGCVVAALGAAAALRLWRTAILLVAYLLCTSYLVIVGLHSDRLQTTFIMALLIGTALAIVETRGGLAQAPEGPPARAALLPAAVVTVLVFLYAGSFIGTSRLRETFASQVLGRPGVALKIGGDARIDRSLYIIADRRLIYTRHDALEVGATRRFGKLANDKQSNSAFVEPNAFLD